jgi:hypothetical protein
MIKLGLKLLKYTVCRVVYSYELTRIYSWETANSGSKFSLDAMKGSGSFCEFHISLTVPAVKVCIEDEPWREL